MANPVSKNGLFLIGNIIKNVVKGDKEALDLQPDITTEGKITKLMASFIYTPNVVVDEALKYMDDSNYKRVVKAQLTTFTAVLLQSFRVLAEVYSQSANMIINKMSNPGKLGNIKDIHSVANLIGSEDIDYTKDLLTSDGRLPITVGTEAPKNNTLSVVNNTANTKDSKIFTTTYEVQLLVQNEVNGEDRVITIPVIIYPNIRYVNVESLIKNRLDTKVGESFLERFDDYRAGVISLSDLVFATDLVQKYRERKLRNPNEFAAYLNKVDKISTVKDVINNHNNFHKNFNIYIFDKNIQPVIERMLRGSVLKDKNKDKLTDSLYAFSVTFVDIENEEVTILLDSIPGFSVSRIDLLKSDKNNEVADAIKEIMKNRQPF